MDNPTEDERVIFPKYPERYQVKLKDLAQKVQEVLSGESNYDRFLREGKISIKSDSWKKQDFDLYRSLEASNGPIIEVAGPTDPGFDLVDLSKVDKKMYVSNITPGLPIWDKEGKPLGYLGKVDLQADATKLPFKPESLGALLVSCLNLPAREEFLYEAKRVLEAKGLLVMQGIDTDELELAKKLGFEVTQYHKTFSKHVDNPQEEEFINAVLVKT